MKIRKADLVFIGSLILAGVLLLSVLLLTRKPGGKIIVRVGGSVAAELSLSEDKEYVLETDYGTNVLTVSGGKARVTAADCPDGLCMGMGIISSHGQSIVCLPHKLVIEIYSAGNDSGVDIVAGRG